MLDAFPGSYRGFSAIPPGPCAETGPVPNRVQCTPSALVARPVPAALLYHIRYVPSVSLSTAPPTRGLASHVPPPSTTPVAPSVSDVSPLGVPRTTTRVMPV